MTKSMPDLPPLIGLCVKDAVKLLTLNKIKIRIRKFNGKVYDLDFSVKQDRVNLVIEDGIIIDSDWY